jgi:hypothetical protein
MLDLSRKEIKSKVTELVRRDLVLSNYDGKVLNCT